jgi:dihydrofolate synthase/folylpolyglutamate synthase
LELLTVDGHEILLDGAHNPAGAAALAQALDDLRPHLGPGPLRLVVASMADKDVDGIIDALARTSTLAGATVIATTVDAARALPAEDLAERWRERVGDRLHVVAEPDPRAALDRARDLSGPTVVAGSLYLVGAVRALLVDDPELRDPPPP